MKKSKWEEKGVRKRSRGSSLFLGAFSCTIQEFLQKKPLRSCVCGRVIALFPSSSGSVLWLRDATGIIKFFSSHPLALRLGDRVAVLACWSGAKSRRSGQRIEKGKAVAESVHLLYRYRGLPATRSSWEDFFWGLKNPKILPQRASLYDAIRAFFRRRRYLEVQTPILHPYPALDPGIHSIPAFLHIGGRKRRYYLQSSPEYFMKMLLVAECRKIFQLAPVFRQGEFSPLHNPEFTLLEWYRSDANYLTLMKEVESLLYFLVRKLCGKTVVNRMSHRVDFTPPWERWKLVDVFRRYTGLPIYRTADFYHLPEMVSEEVKTAAPGFAWKDIYFYLLTKRVEPNLGIRRPVFLYDYPAELGTMSKPKKDDPSTLERFELYIAGIELANGYSELTETREQAKRFRQELKERSIRGLPTEFLRALAYGLPSCAGVAVGVDRLLMILFEYPTLASVLPFSLSRR